MKDFLGEAFAAVWVVGEAQRVRPSARGHVYFELVEKGDHDEIIGKLDAVIWKTSFARLRFKPEEGLEVVLDVHHLPGAV